MFGFFSGNSSEKIFFQHKNPEQYVKDVSLHLKNSSNHDISKSAIESLFVGTCENSSFKGVVAEGKGNVKEAEQLYKKALKKIPFYEPLGLTVMNFYAQTKKDEKAAYDLVLKLIKYNENSLDYNLAYIHLALSQGDFFFADEALKDVERMMDADDFNEYLEVFEEKKKVALDKLDEGW